MSDQSGRGSSSEQERREALGVGYDCCGVRWNAREPHPCRVTGRQETTGRVSSSGSSPDPAGSSVDPGRGLPSDRCQSWTRLHGHDYACSYPARAEHDECMALVRGDNGQDVAVKWAKR